MTGQQLRYLQPQRAPAACAAVVPDTHSGRSGGRPTARAAPPGPVGDLSPSTAQHPFHRFRRKSSLPCCPNTSQNVMPLSSAIVSSPRFRLLLVISTLPEFAMATHLDLEPLPWTLQTVRRANGWRRISNFAAVGWKRRKIGSWRKQPWVRPIPIPVPALTGPCSMGRCIRTCGMRAGLG